MRKKLYDLRRKELDITQAEMAAKIGCTRATYSAIENGTRAGRDMFWNSFQNAFKIPDAEMWGFKKNEK